MTVPVVLLGSGVGAAVFGAIDSLVPGRTVVYRRGATPATVVTPFLTRQGAGIRGIVRWR